jgi:hypothetical protein
MIPRTQVYAAIDGERDYQDSLPPSRTDGQPRTVGDYLTMLSYYLDQARADWTMNPGNEPALAQIRKIAAISVRCMEEHGVIERGTQT